MRRRGATRPPRRIMIHEAKRASASGLHFAFCSAAVRVRAAVAVVNNSAPGITSDRALRGAGERARAAGGNVSPRPPASARSSLCGSHLPPGKDPSVVTRFSYRYFHAARPVWHIERKCFFHLLTSSGVLLCGRKVCVQRQ